MKQPNSVYTRLFFLMIMVVLIVTENSVSQTDSITIEDALQRMISTHPLIKQAQISSESVSRTIEKSRSAYFPKITGHVNYARMEPVNTIPVGTRPVPFQPPNNFNFYGELFQNVIDFGRRKTEVSLAHNAYEQSQTSLHTMKSDLIYQTIDAFYRLLFLYRDIDVQKDEIEVLNKHLDVTKRLVASGSATPYDILEVRVRIAESGTSLTEINNQLLNTEYTLKYLLTISDSISLIPRGDFSVPVISLNADSLIEIALKKSPDMETARQKEQATFLQYNAAKAAYWPVIGFNAQGGFKNGIIPDINTLQGYYTLRGQLVITIFNGLELRNAVKEAQLNYHAAEENVQNTRQNMEREIHQAVNNIRSAKTVFLEAEPQVRLADTAYSLAQVRYEAGVITSVDLLDAQTRKRQAQLLKIQTEFKLKMAYFELRRIIGEITDMIDF